MIVGGFDSELLELVPDRRLVFRCGFVGPQRRQGPSVDTLLTVSYHPERPAPPPSSSRTTASMT